MKGRTTLILFISIAVLGGVIWLQESWRARTPPKELKRLRIFELDADTLISIEFKLTNMVVTCSKESGSWLAGESGTGMGRADAAMVQRMISGLNSMGKGTTITSKQLEMRGLDSAEYGFDLPAVEITTVDNRGRRTWLVGRRTALGEMVYVKEADKDEIYTLPDKLLLVVPSKASVLRDRMLFAGEATGVRRVEIRGSSGFIQIVKDVHAGWRIQQSIAAQADPKEVEDYIDQLYRLRIDDFVADNVSDFSVYGLQTAGRQIALGAADGSSRMLMLGDEVPDRPGFVYARRADDTSVFMLNADVIALLNVKVDRFRDARILPMALDEISSIHISKGSEQLGLVREDTGQWMLTTPVAWRADVKAVADLIMLWGSAVITDFNVATNGGSAEWTLEFGSASSSITNTIRVLPAGDRKDGLYVQRDDESTLYQINLPLFDESAIDVLGYKDRQVWLLNRDEVNKIAVLKEGRPPQIVERQEDLSFAFVETNANLRIDTEVISGFLDQMADIRTSGYITYNPRDLEIYGLANPALELHVGLSGSNQLGRVLLVGRETTQGFYSMVKGRDVVFYLQRPVVEVLSSDLVAEGNGPASGAE